MKIAYLGPAGSYNEEALHASAGHPGPAGSGWAPHPTPTIFDAIGAVDKGVTERALVPFENSIEGSVRATLDALAFEAKGVQIVGEHDHPIRHNLIAGSAMAVEEVKVVLSHPQANAQCARYLRDRLGSAEVRAVASTSEAVRLVAERVHGDGWAALGSEAAARAYGGVVLESGVEDEAVNVTRFVWLAPEGTEVTGGEAEPWRTTLVFSELGADHPGALVDALTEFSDRGINLTRIESRPRRQGLGSYLFFIDLEGAASQPLIGESLDALREKAESVRILGSYPVGGAAPLA